MFSSGLAFLSLAVSATVVSAQIAINNYCNFDIYIYQSTNGGCDYGWTSFDTCSENPSECFGDSSYCFGLPWIIGASTTYNMPWIEDGLGTSMKIATDSSFNSVLQFEYTWSDGIYWDLSLLNGGADGTVGTPFEDYNVSVGPSVSGTNTCTFIGCIAGYVCEGAYYTPYDDATNYCPTTNDAFFVDLCVGI